MVRRHAGDAIEPRFRWRSARCRDPEAEGSCISPGTLPPPACQPAVANEGSHAHDLPSSPPLGRPRGALCHIRHAPSHHELPCSGAARRVPQRLAHRRARLRSLRALRVPGSPRGPEGSAAPADEPHRLRRYGASSHRAHGARGDRRTALVHRDAPRLRQPRGSHHRGELQHHAAGGRVARALCDEARRRVARGGGRREEGGARGLRGLPAQEAGSGAARAGGGERVLGAGVSDPGAREEGADPLVLAGADAGHALCDLAARVARARPARCRRDARRGSQPDPAAPAHGVRARCGLPARCQGGARVDGGAAEREPRGRARSSRGQAGAGSARRDAAAARYERVARARVR